MANILSGEAVILGARAVDKGDAIRQAGEILVKVGCVAPAYVDGMLARERVLSTYLGNGIAIPHGERNDLQYVYGTGFSVAQFPNGVAWEPGENAYLVIGLASANLEHAEVLSNLVELLQEPETIEQMVHTSDPMVIVKRLTRRRRELEWK